ncbi:MAG: sulfite exporter TauE/SafE family protein [Actinobacteria bacterium]|nr:sulfite exporter TauE/SafE family protein [Actinomycetota bacterium]
MGKKPGTKECEYFIKGMHCASCEIIIEKKLIELENVHSVEASTPKAGVLVEHEGQAPSVGQLNRLFEEEGYSFSLSPTKSGPVTAGRASYAKIALAVLLAIGLFILLEKAGLSRLVTVNSKSSLPVFFLLGIAAGFSSCAALVGGIILSMSKQWSELHSSEDALKKKLEPHLLFNSGRLVSYAALGAVLALAGGTFKISPTFSAGMVIVISMVMVVLGLQMLGVRFLQRFQFSMPRAVTRYVADETHFKGRYMPFMMGAMTFFLPCGFTITAQGFALLSGRPLQGSMIMLAFALGTLPMLLLIGFTSVKFLERPRLVTTFLKVAGIVVLFFAVYNVNNQLVVLNLPSLTDLIRPTGASGDAANAQMPPIVDGKQVVGMEASASEYKPNYLRAWVGIPVRWEINDTGTSGCTNAIISKDLFEGQISLTPGKTSVKEFTPKKPGRFKFSCWMGMVGGTFEFLDEKDVPGKASESLDSAEDTTPAQTPQEDRQETRGQPDSAGDTTPAPAPDISNETETGLPPIVDGKQILEMNASRSGYSPNQLKVRVGVPVKWEIKDTGTSGCTNAIISKDLFEGQISLTPGKTSVKEFTPRKVGRFRFSCWMGMVEGVIDVVDEKDPNRSKFDYDETTSPDPGGCPCCG